MHSLFSAITIDRYFAHANPSISLAEHIKHAAVNIALLVVATFGIFSALAIALHRFL